MEQGMVKCEVIKKFNYGHFEELKNLKRSGFDIKGVLFTGDTFECSQEVASYLSGNNPIKEVVVKVIEVIPEEKPIKIDLEDPYKDYEEPKPKKTTKKKTSKK